MLFCQLRLDEICAVAKGHGPFFREGGGGKLNFLPIKVLFSMFKWFCGEGKFTERQTVRQKKPYVIRNTFTSDQTLEQY